MQPRPVRQSEFKVCLSVKLSATETSTCLILVTCPTKLLTNGVADGGACRRKGSLPGLLAGHDPNPRVPLALLSSCCAVAVAAGVFGQWPAGDAEDKDPRPAGSRGDSELTGAPSAPHWQREVLALSSGHCGTGR